MAKKVNLSQLVIVVAKIGAWFKNLLTSQKKEVTDALANKVDDAPKDGAQYARKDGAWAKVEAESEADEYATDAEVEAAIDEALKNL